MNGEGQSVCVAMCIEYENAKNAKNAKNADAAKTLCGL